jgi:DNA-binding transcriptional ArsR family regulator
MNEKQLVKILKALANPRRFEILINLKKHRSLNVSAIAEKIDLSFRSTSKHLLKLEDAGLVERRHQSREVFYVLTPKIIRNIIGSFARMSE